MASAILASPLLTSLAVAPGNPGTAEHNIDLDVTDHDAVVEWCRAHDTDLVVVGPEVPLVAGIVDALAVAGIRAFGPTRAAAQLEGSKTFTREFAARHGIPGPRIASFTEAEPAIAWLDELGVPVVVKADGLAAGKGVVIPESTEETVEAIRSMLSGETLGDAGARILLEERLDGPEVSLIGFCDGLVARGLPTAQDHKRVGEGDTGLNTGGMGAYTPVPGIDADQYDELVATFLQRTVDGMAAEGNPFIGMLYAGLMLTADGPRLIEYNTRFGDPEAQILLALLESDVLAIMMACTDGSLAEHDLAVSPGAAAIVVVAAEGYPGTAAKHVPIPEVEIAPPVQLIHAGTALTDEGSLVSNGGRVLNIVATGDDLRAALNAANNVVAEIVAAEPKLFARRDIGFRALDGASS